jgi:hypothetical protein
MDSVILSTGDIKMDYEIVDIVFATQVIRSHWVRSGGRETLEFLPQVNEKLRQAAIEKGCDAVIWIDYDFDRDPHVQILTAYGTGVKTRK